MERDTQARKRFKDKQWDSLEAMIEAYAAEAITIARTDFHEQLGYDEASIDKLERILNRLCPAPEPLPSDESAWLTLLWGGFFGELLRHLHGGTWAMTLYPRGEFSVPTLEIGASPTAAPSRLYPMMKVNRRLTLGAEEGLPAFYIMLRTRLGAATPKLPN